MRTQTLPPEYSRQADKFLSSLAAKAEQRIKDGIEKIPLGDIVPYKAKKGYKYGFSVGNSRAVQSLGR